LNDVHLILFTKKARKWLEDSSYAGGGKTMPGTNATAARDMRLSFRTSFFTFDSKSSRVIWSYGKGISKKFISQDVGRL
jgi:hypothetical protein